MLAVFRNPLLRLLGRFWWLPVLTAIVAGFGSGGTAGFTLAATAVSAGLALIAGMVGTAWLHGAAAALQEKRRHRDAHHRFLCPSCMMLDTYRFACPDCGTPIEPLAVHTRGRYVDSCSHCGSVLPLARETPERQVRAYCRHCESACDRHVYHERQVRVLGTLLEPDYAALRERAGGSTSETRSRGIAAFHTDDGERITWVLNLGNLSEVREAIPPEHVLHGIEALWVRSPEPLPLGQAVDRLARQGELDESRLAQIAVCVEAASLDPAAERILTSRFGRLAFEVPSAAFLRQGADTRVSGSERPAPRLEDRVPTAAAPLVDGGSDR